MKCLEAAVSAASNGGNNRILSEIVAMYLSRNIILVTGGRICDDEFRAGRAGVAARRWHGWL